MRREIKRGRANEPVEGSGAYHRCDFRPNVKARRMAAGLLQPELSRLSGVSERFTCKVGCVVSNPSLEAMAMLAAAANCTVTDCCRTNPGQDPPR